MPSVPTIPDRITVSRIHSVGELTIHVGVGLVCQACFAFQKSVDLPSMHGCPLLRSISDRFVEDVGQLRFQQLPDDLLVLEPPWPLQQSFAPHLLQVFFQLGALYSSLRNARCNIPQCDLCNSLRWSHLSNRSYRLGLLHLERRTWKLLTPSDHNSLVGCSLTLERKKAKCKSVRRML